MNFRSTTERIASGVQPEITAEGRPRTRSGARSQIFFWAKILLTVLVVGLLVITIHPREILLAFSGARYPLVVISIVLVIPNLTLRAFKWGYILRQVKPGVTVREIVNNLLIGFTFAVVTPGQLGEFGRAFFIAGRPRLELIGLSFIDKFYNLLPIVLVGTLGLLLLPGLVLDGNTYLFISSAILVGVLWGVSLLILLSPRWIRDLLYAVNVMLPYRDKIKTLLSGLDPIQQKQSLIIAVLGVSHYLVSIFQYYLLVLSFQQVGLFDSLRASAATLFTKAALPISIGGLGVGETASVGFFRIFGVGQATAFNSSVMLFSMNVLFPAILGFFVLLKQRIVTENNDV